MIVIGARFRKSGRVRRIMEIRDGRVNYVIEGMLTLAPLRVPVAEFATWAEEAEPL